MPEKKEKTNVSFVEKLLKRLVDYADKSFPSMQGTEKEDWVAGKVNNLMERFDNLIPVLGQFADLKPVDDAQKYLVQAAVRKAYAMVKLHYAENPPVVQQSRPPVERQKELDAVLADLAVPWPDVDENAPADEPKPQGQVTTQSEPDPNEGKTEPRVNPNPTGETSNDPPQDPADESGGLQGASTKRDTTATVGADNIDQSALTRSTTDGTTTVITDTKKN